MFRVRRPGVCAQPRHPDAAGVMVILFVHCLRDLPLTQPRGTAPLAALAVTVGLHLWRRNALLSIIGGTAVSVALASTLFAA
ncbi:MAG: AzlD domain-containing protein [Streptomyces sp.]|nr:AzlD domain-containing protein [Streptomyces sp.]